MKSCIMNLRCFSYLTNHGNQSYCRPNSYLSNYLCSDVELIKPLYTKGGLWIKQFSFSNLLCAQATWAITNHAPIGEYRLRFFPSEDFSCPYRSYSTKTKHHILYNCRIFNKYWNLMRDKINQFILFLEFNPNTFSFRESITWVYNLAAILVIFLIDLFFSFLFFSFYA